MNSPIQQADYFSKSNQTKLISTIKYGTNDQLVDYLKELKETNQLVIINERDEFGDTPLTYCCILGLGDKMSTLLNIPSIIFDCLYLEHTNKVLIENFNTKDPTFGMILKQCTPWLMTLPLEPISSLIRKLAINNEPEKIVYIINHIKQTKLDSLTTNQLPSILHLLTNNFPLQHTPLLKLIFNVVSFQNIFPNPYAYTMENEEEEEEEHVKFYFEHPCIYHYKKSYTYHCVHYKYLCLALSSLVQHIFDQADIIKWISCIKGEDTTAAPSIQLFSKYFVKMTTTFIQNNLGYKSTEKHQLNYCIHHFRQMGITFLESISHVQQELLSAFNELNPKVTHLSSC